MFEKAVEFLKNSKGRNIVIYDTDGDGISAAVIVAKTLKILFGKYPKAMPGDHDLLYITSSRDEISRQNADSIIIVDMSVDNKAGYISRLARKHKILIIDHHQSHKNMNRNKNIVHVNPCFWKSKIPSFRYAASKIAFDICRKAADIEDLDWLAGVGIINDYSGKSWRGFLNKIYKKYPYLKGRDNYSFENRLGYITHLITSGYYPKKRSGKIGYDACMKAETPMDIIRTKSEPAKRLKRMYDCIEKEIKDTMKVWRKEAELIDDKELIILNLKTKFSIQSTISTKVSILKPNKTVIVARRSGREVHISFRRQDRKVDCGKLARTSTKNLKNANGGGHAPAAGGKIMARDWEKFRKNVIRLL